MAMSKADSRRMYSWWWNSHISPKNSKWLQENLTDMDISVKSMIKLIEEDADSFARRAEMYYKKRPELMKLVEEFYRAYRALAERYDHATGALRQAHRTMTEAFPNQVPLLPDDSPANSAIDGDPQTPEMRTPARSMFDLDDFQNDEPSDVGQKGLKQLNDLVSSKGTVRKGLKFDHVGVTNEEIISLKEAIAKLEKEKEAGLKKYEESLERLTKLESEISHAQEDSKKLTDKASKAEAEVQNLKDTLHGLEAEKEEVLELYHQCLEKMTNLEIDLSQAQENIDELNEQAKNGENVAQILKQDIARLENEKNAAHYQYKQSLEIKSNLEKKLMEAEEEAKKLTKRAENAENEVETLKQAITKLTEEKEAQAFLYQQCLEIISSLELRLSGAQEEAKRLNGEIDNGVSMLKGVEDQCLTLEKSNQALHSELESMVLKMGNQTRELTEKEKEMGKLWTCIQEERLRFVEAETAFQTLQHLHSQAQEELRSMALELQNKAQILREMEARNHGLQGEIQKHIEENKNLNEINLSSAISLKEMQFEISKLIESKGKLEEEVVLRVDQRNALQQEIYCLKEELNELNKDHKAILEQVSCVGLKPEAIGSSVKELQDENSILKEEFQTERSVKVALLEKLEVMGQLLEKNVVLENSLSDLGVELEGARGKIKALEESYQALLEETSSLSVEKANLLGQLQVTTENLSLVSEKNNVLESSLLEAHVEIELLKQKSKSFEDSCHSLADEKSTLITEKGALVSQMEIIEKLLNDLDRRYKDLEEKYSAMEKERESTLQKVEELHVSLTIKSQEHVSYAQTNKKQLDRMRTQIQLLQEEKHNRSKEFDQELDKALGSEIEIFILKMSVQEIEETNLSLFNDCQKLLEASKLSERLIRELKQEKYENQVKITSLADQNNRLRIGLHQLLKVSGISLNPECEFDQEQTYFDNIRSKLEGKNRALVEMENKNQELVVEISILVTMLRQLQTEMADLEAEKYSFYQESYIRAEKILELQNEAEKLSKANEELRSKVSEGDHNEEVLRTQLDNLHKELLIVQGVYKTLQTENSVVIEEKSSLAKNNFDMEGRIRCLEEENGIIFDEAFCQSTLSLVLEKYLDEKHAEINGVSQDLQNLHGVNITLVEKVSMVEKKLEEAQMENLHLKETLQKSTHELKTVTSTHDHLNTELLTVNNVLHLKERQHMEATQKLTILENEKANLTSVLAGLQKEYGEIKMKNDEQGKHILKLSEDNDHLSKEHISLHERSKLLELKTHQLCEDLERSKHREETLCSELQKEKNEAQSLEAQASEVYGDLQNSTFHQVLLEEKVRELTEVCLSLQDESTSKNLDIELLNEKTSVLECENGDLKARLAAYGPALISLKDCILSLENHTSVQKFENDEAKDDEQVVNVQDLQSKVKAIETSVIDMKKLKTQEKLDADAKLESAMKQIEELRSQNGRQKSTSEISKDIMLDEASEYSSCGISKRELVEGEIWEITDQNSSIDMNVDHTKVKVKVKQFEDEKLEVSKRFDEGNKRKVLERLNSDVQKLTNLQITIEDLKRKLEITETSRRGKAMVECETLKGQLMEAELSIQKLYEVNGKLVKHVDSEKSTTESEESQSARRKRISEQARKVSEKIGRLQLEVQRIQFVLLKLDDEVKVKVKGKNRFLDANQRVLLKDYLYGGGKTNATISKVKGKKRHFCACVVPPTKGD